MSPFFSPPPPPSRGVGAFLSGHYRGPIWEPKTKKQVKTAFLKSVRSERIQKSGHLPPLFDEKRTQFFCQQNAKIKARDRGAHFQTFPPPPPPPPPEVRGAHTTPPPVGAIFQPPC